MKQEKKAQTQIIEAKKARTLAKVVLELLDKKRARGDKTGVQYADPLGHGTVKISQDGFGRVLFDTPRGNAMLHLSQNKSKDLFTEKNVDRLQGMLERNVSTITSFLSENEMRGA